MKQPATRTYINELIKELDVLDYGIRRTLDTKVQFIKYPVTIPSDRGHGYSTSEIKTFGIMRLDGSKIVEVPYYYGKIYYNYKAWQKFCDMLGIELEPKLHSSDALEGEYPMLNKGKSCK